MGKEIDKHRAESEEREHEPTEETGRARTITIVEALMLAVVAVLAAWSGYASAKWGTESALKLAKASAARTEANRADLESLNTKNFDASTFNAWFDTLRGRQPDRRAHRHQPLPAGLQKGVRLVDGDRPRHQPACAQGPHLLPDYVQPGVAHTAVLDATANAYYATGERDGENSDNYVRTTVFLASVLFLVGISGHFRVRAARIGLIVVGATILCFSVVLLATSPKPPL